MNSSSGNLVAIFEKALRDNWDHRSLSDYGGNSFSYSDIGKKIFSIHSLFKDYGIKKGDKIALLGKNSSNWGIIYLATVTYGAVIVPILPDFKPIDVHTIITHSDAVILFVEESIYKDLDPASMPLLQIILSIPELTVLHTRIPSVTLSPLPEITRNSISFSPADGEDIAVISYTSGTTGFSKGVVLQHKSLLGNILFAQRNMPLNPRDKILSFLPLAHTYGCAFEFLFPFTLGCDIVFLTKTPSPKIIMQAFQEIRPSLILSVPLVIEKIYKTQILPIFRKPLLHYLIQVPLLNVIPYKKIRQKMIDVFGGNFRELVIGGAPFNTEAERFFKKMDFPFTVGYGMTECGPLIAYASWKTTQLGASGRVVNELEVRIDSSDPYYKAGEILLHGNHVMLGYYKNEEATRAVIDEAGWLHTGDLGVIDHEGNIYIKGRSKSMILGPSGKNIYPEEIEAILNNRFMVMESLIIERANKLFALIYPDYDAVTRAGYTKEQLPAIYKGYLHDLHHHLPKHIQISDFEIVANEFEKTPKKSIKRFLYH
ncbi:MAG: AMP-binding protein [Bacteroidales bacterium]|nr:AMP-binding protein [Bacteroidales bacterium]MDD4602496.1 AMP-binding protein [Bacteroidales bacterium]